MKSKPEVTYVATLNDLKKWFDEEGMSHDKPICFCIEDGQVFAVASVYKDAKGHLCVDLE